MLVNNRMDRGRYTLKYYKTKKGNDHTRTIYIKYNLVRVNKRWIQKSTLCMIPIYINDQNEVELSYDLRESVESYQ